VPTSERLREGETEEGSREGERRREESKDASVIPVSQVSVAPVLIDPTPFNES